MWYNQNGGGGGGISGIFNKLTKIPNKKNMGRAAYVIFFDKEFKFGNKSFFFWGGGGVGRGGGGYVICFFQIGKESKSGGSEILLTNWQRI